jgi:hypothetical protein
LLQSNTHLWKTFLSFSFLVGCVVSAINENIYKISQVTLLINRSDSYARSLFVYSFMANSIRCQQSCSKTTSGCWCLHPCTLGFERYVALHRFVGFELRSVALHWFEDFSWLESLCWLRRHGLCSSLRWSCYFNLFCSSTDQVIDSDPRSLC